MANQNLVVELDLFLLNKAIRGKFVEPHKWVDSTGEEHASVTLLVTECKTPTDKKTHNVAIKATNEWKPAKDHEGKILYAGKATPSKYQPDSVQQQSYTDTANNYGSPLEVPF